MGYEPLLKTQKCHLLFLAKSLTPSFLAFPQVGDSQSPFSGYPLCLKQIRKLPHPSPHPTPILSLRAIQIGACKLYETLSNEGVTFRTILSQLRISFSVYQYYISISVLLSIYQYFRISVFLEPPTPPKCQIFHWTHKILSIKFFIFNPMLSFKGNNFLVKISQFEFLVKTKKNIFVL